MTATSSARFYFQDIKTGEELDHPMNGCPVGGAGPSVLHNGEYIHGHRTIIWADFGTKGRRQVPITSADFGGRCVRVKMWAPNPEARETFVLVPETWTPRPARKA
jgi:hypothetical protein